MFVELNFIRLDLLISYSLFATYMGFNSSLWTDAVTHSWLLLGTFWLTVCVCSYLAFAYCFCDCLFSIRLLLWVCIYFGYSGIRCGYL